MNLGNLQSISAIVSAVLLPILALALMQSPCPLYVGVNNDGNLFFDRFQGWIKVDATQLASVLDFGCRTYAGSPPEPFTSVRFVAAPKAPKEKIDLVFSLLEKNGWPKEKISVEPWTSNIRKLSGRFHMDKQTFSIGEPVILHFEVTNSGSDPYWLDTTGLPGMPLCSGYSVQVFKPDMTPLTDTRSVHGNTCIMNGQFTHTVINPGAKYTQDIDLGLYLDVTTKGSYVIRARHSHWLRRNGTPDGPLDRVARFKLDLQ